MPHSPKQKVNQASSDSEEFADSSSHARSHRAGESSPEGNDVLLEATDYSSPSKDGSVQEVAASASAKKRHHSRSHNPRLNTWDVPEFLPGAQPGATAVQREYFQDRSIKVFRKEQMLQKLDDQESETRKSEQFAEKLETDMTRLRELFPSVDIEVIQETYLIAEGDMNTVINQLLLISDGTTGIELSEKPGPPSSDDEREFPVLTDKEGWEVVSPDIQLTIEETDNIASSGLYKDKLMEKANHANNDQPSR
jgi:hypothetical protein